MDLAFKNSQVFGSRRGIRRPSVRQKLQARSFGVPIKINRGRVGDPSYPCALAQPRPEALPHRARCRRRFADYPIYALPFFLCRYSSRTIFEAKGRHGLGNRRIKQHQNDLKRLTKGHLPTGRSQALSRVYFSSTEDILSWNDQLATVRRWRGKPPVGVTLLLRGTAPPTSSLVNTFGSKSVYLSTLDPWPLKASSGAGCGNASENPRCSCECRPLIWVLFRSTKNIAGVFHRTRLRPDSRRVAFQETATFNWFPRSADFEDPGL
jgi:hypothetical protein